MTEARGRARLTDTKIKATKPGAKNVYLTDGAGLHLLVTPKGARLWRYKVVVAGKARTFSYGTYPDVSLAQARTKHDEVRALIAKGIDPGEAKREEKRKAAAAARDTFLAAAEELIEAKVKAGKRPLTIRHMRLMLDLLSPLHRRPIKAITTAELLDAILKVNDRGARSSALRCRAFAGAVFNLAILKGRADFNPAQPLSRSGALDPHKPRHMPAIIEPKAFGKLLRDLDTVASGTSRRALQFLVLTGLRTNEVRLMRWEHVDWGNARLIVPPEHVKTDAELMVPLSRQALAILRAQQEATGKRTLVFGSRSGDRPLHRATLLKIRDRLGYAGVHTVHGFRSTFSSILNETNMWSPDAIEISAGRKDTAGSRGRYNRSERWDERVRMMAWWANYCEQLKKGIAVVGPNEVSTAG